MRESKGTASGGVGVTGLLTVAFVVLKLVGVIDWSWWWVLAPTWVGTILGLLLLGIAVVLEIISNR